MTIDDCLCDAGGTQNAIRAGAVSAVDSPPTAAFTRAPARSVLTPKNRSERPRCYWFEAVDANGRTQLRCRWR